MIKHDIFVFVITISIFLLSGCQYQTDDVHFVDLGEPPVKPEVEINIRDIGKGATIYIYDNTRLAYTVDTESQQHFKITATLGGASLFVNENAFYIFPSLSPDEREYELKVKVELKSSGTGSLTDRLYLEQYIGEFTYKVRFLQSDLKLNVIQKTTPSGALKLEWDDPDLKQSPVVKYNVSYYDIWSEKEKSFDILDPEQTYFIDEDYAYGFREYRVTAYFKEDKISPWRDVLIAQYTPLTIEDLNLNLRQQYSSERYLELLWDKPEIPRMPVLGYKIEYYNELSRDWKRINIDPSQTSYVDEDYAYGDRQYRFTVFLYKESLPFSTQYTPAYRKLSGSDMVFEDIDIETVRLSWPQMEFNCTQLLYLFDRKSILIPEGVNSFTFRRLEFPFITWTKNNLIELYMVGKKTPYDLEWHPNFFGQGAIGKRYTYDQLCDIYRPLSFAFCAKYDLLYVLARTGIYSINMKTREMTRHLSFDEETIDLAIAFDPYSSRVAVKQYGVINVYKDHTFTNPIKIDLKYGASAGYSIFKFTSKNELLVTSNTTMWNYKDVEFKAFNADTGEVLYAIPIPTSGKDLARLKITPDDKYVFMEVYESNDPSIREAHIYELRDNKLCLLESIPSEKIMENGSLIGFYSSNPVRIIQGSLENFRIMELPSYNKVADIQGEFCSIDAVNQNFLYTNYINGERYVHIMNPSLTEELLRVRVSGSPLSYNNMLISSDQNAWGAYFDLTKFMKKSK